MQCCAPRAKKNWTNTYSPGLQPRACQTLHIIVFLLIDRYSLTLVPFLGACFPKDLSSHTPLEPTLATFGLQGSSFKDLLKPWSDIKRQRFFDINQNHPKRRISRPRTPPVPKMTPKWKLLTHLLTYIFDIVVNGWKALSRWLFYTFNDFRLPKSSHLACRFQLVCLFFQNPPNRACVETQSPHVEATRRFWHHVRFSGIQKSPLGATFSANKLLQIETFYDREHH